MSSMPSRNHVVPPCLLLALAFITGCGSGGQIRAANSGSPSSNSSSGSAASFSVTAVSPANGSTQVALSAVVQIAFSSPADSSTVDAANIRVTAPNAVAGAVTYSASTNTATFTPSAPLAASSTYTVTVSGVTSSTGTEMTGTFMSDFATVTGAPASGSGNGNNNGSNGYCPNAETLGLPGPPPCLQYDAFLLAANGGTNPGTIMIDTSGNVTAEFESVPEPPAAFTVQPNTTFMVQFCPAYNVNTSANPPQCFNAGAVTSDASGIVNSTFKFPRPGDWAGDFQVYSGNTVLLHTSFPANMPQTETLAQPVTELLYTLQPETQVNGTGIAVGAQAQDPLSSGPVKYNAKGTIGFWLYGAPPNTAYITYESATPAVGGASTYELNTFTTDGTGYGDSEPFPNVAGGDVFTVEPQDSSHAGWIGGFSVPQ